MGSLLGMGAAMLLLASAPVISAGTMQSQTNTYVGPDQSVQLSADVTTHTFDINRFVLPDAANVLVVVEGGSGSVCSVSAYEKTADGWALRTEADGHMGMNGMNAHRICGDKTTPIGLFQMNTPFGQAPALSGFPENYIQVNQNYTWTDDTNRLVSDPTQIGEHVGTSGYSGYYDYVIDMGFNKNALANQGSALFLHCEGDFRNYTSGCVAIPKDKMAEIMKLYGNYGDGHCFIALAPAGKFDPVYDSFGVNDGLSPN